MSYALKDFEWRRVGLLARRGLAQDWRKLAPGVAAFSVVFLAATTLAHLLGGADGMAAAFFWLALGFGWVYTARSFVEVHDKLAAPLALQLPASTAEKMVAGWLLSAVGYAVAAAAGIFLLHQLSYFIQTEILGAWLRAKGTFQMIVNGRPVERTAAVWSFFPGQPLSPLLFYLGLQPLFLWGGLRFSSSPFVRTLIVLGGGAAIGLLSAGLLRNCVDILNDSFGHGAWDARAVFRELMAGLRVAFWVLAPLLSVLFGYRLLRDAQG